MNKLDSNGPCSAPAARRHGALLSLLAAPLLGLLLAAVLAACGGGVGSGGTGSYVSGPVTGFGSVIVNGVRFDDSAAAVEDGDGARRSRDDLRLGMTVEIESSAIASSSGSGPTATASRIRFEAELAGPVGLVDLAGGAFTLLGQRVTVDATTVFDDALAGGVAALATGRHVAVYGAWDPAAERYRATRVEAGSALAPLRLRGLLAAVDSAALTLRIGATTYSYAGASGVPSGLVAGQVVRLRLAAATTPPRWVVQAFGEALRPLPDGEEAKLKGLITGLVPVQGGAALTGLRVNGQPVDLTAAQIPDGRAALVLGARVEVEGRVQGGQLRATLVTVRSDLQEEERGFEVNGLILSVDTAAGTLRVRDVTISTRRPDLRIDDGTLADLRVGRQVEVRGVLGSDRRTLEATRIRLR
jgi:Domain of unknown function (DUF5666)